jgi:hypothetical protein
MDVQTWYPRVDVQTWYPGLESAYGDLRPEYICENGHAAASYPGALNN